MTTTVSALTRKQRQELERELRAELARLDRAIAAAREEALSPLVREGSGSIPGGDPVGEVDIAIRSRVHDRRDAVLAALQRLVDGSYGICAGCGEPIPYGRLLVMPESELCVRCGARA